MKYKRTQKRSKQMWQRVEKFSIRKFSFGAASCLIGAITVLGSSSQIANADGITSYEANGDKVTAYAHGESVYKLRGTSTSIYNAFRMDVDTSKYTKENPVITVTLTYNAPDNPNEKAPIFWSGRPFHWFTVPEGTEELGDDYKLTLTNGSGVTNEYTNWSSWESNSRFIHSKYNNNPDAWERHNTTTGEMLRKTPFVSLNSEFNKFLGDYNNRWYDNSNMPTQEIMHDLRAKSRSIYADWEKRAAGTVTVTYTTKVKDPVNTKELTIGMGVYQELNRQQYARVETVKLPVLYKLNELFEPKVPERTGVANPNQLTVDEVNAIKAKIWAANVNNENELLSTNKLFKDNLKDSSNNGANSISIDKATGDATITYKDDTTDTIKGSELVYEKPKASKDDTSSAELKTDNIQGIKYYIKPVPVKDYNGITSDDRKRALDSFLHENLNDGGYQNYKRGIQFYLISYFKREVKLNVGTNSVQFEFDNNNNLIVKRSYDKRTLAAIPKEDLFLRPTFDVDAARTEAKKVIGSLDNLYPSEKTGFETEINQATEREGIERVLNEAQSKANENAVALAKMKKTANDKINALGYLTPAEKDEAIAKINTATIKQNDTTVDKVSPDTDANREATKARLDSVVAELEKKNLAKAKEEAVNNINNISDENLPQAEKDKYIKKIKDATEVGPAIKDGTVLNIVKEAQEAASAQEAARRKAEADKVRQQYKDMIATIPGLTDDEKKQYNDAIDKATSTDEMDAIVDFAKLSGKRKNAVAEIEKLEHLNNNQKQSFKDLVENSANKEEIENYVSQAKQLNSKMKQLHDLAEKAKTIKSTDKYTSAADDKKTAFDKALEEAESVLDKANGADKSISTVENLFKTLETAINELKPGSEKVKVDVDKSLLQEEYAKGETVKKSPLYKNSTDEGDKTGDDRRNEYNKKLEAAKTILADELAEQTDVDGALEELLSAKADLNGKETDADKAIPTVTNGTVAISVDPATTPRVTEKTDKDAIINAVTVPQGQPQPKSKEFANDGNIEDGTNENANKKVVKVKVTYDDGSSETIEVPVEGTDAAKSPLTPPAKVKVVNPNDLTEDEQKAVKQAVKDANPTLTDDQITVDKTGKVTVTYDDNSKNVLDPSKTVEAKTEEEKTQAEKSPLTPPAKVKVVNPNDLTEDEQKAVKQAVKDANPTLTDDQITVDKTGKVTVTYDDNSKNVLDPSKTVEAKTEEEKTQAEKSPLTPPAKVKVVNPNDLTEDEQKAVKQAVKDANPTLTDDQITVDKTGKVTVTYDDNSKNVLDPSKTVEAKTEEEKTQAEKSPLTPPAKVKVVNPNDLTEDEQKAVKQAVKDANPTLTDDQITVDKTGKVTVTYDDNSKNVLDPSKTVEAKTEEEKTQAEKSPLTPPAKVKVVNPNDLTEDEQKAVKQAVKDANPTLTDDQITVDKTGKVTVTYGDNSKNVLDPSKTVEAKTEEDGSSTSPDATANKTELEKAKEKAKSDLAQAAAKEKAEIDADEKLSEDEKAQAKAKVDEAKKAAESNIDKATTPEEVAKATEDGKKAIDAVHQITPDQAKKDLTDAANAEKGEIGGDTTLTDKEKEALKAKVDEVKKAAEDKINNAKTPEEIAKATEEGKKAIADVYNPQTAKGQSTSIFKPELDLQTALVSGKVTVEKGKGLTDAEILKQLALADGLTAKVISKPTTTETGTKEAEVEVTLADGTKVTVKVPVEVVDSLGTADKDNDLAKAKEDAKKQVEEAAKDKITEIKKDPSLTEEQKQKAEEAINKAKDEANKAIDQASSAGTAKQIADQAKENIEKYDPKADTEVKKPDVTNLDEEKAKAKAEILEEAQKRIDEIKNNKDLSDEAKQKAIEEINKAKDKAIEDINKGQSKDEINAAKEAGIHKINEVQPEGSIASKFDPKVPENKVEVGNTAKLSDEEREQVRQNIEGANTFPDGTTVEVKPDGTAVITYKDGSSDTISKDKLVAPANKETGTIASRTEPVIPGKTQVGNTTKLTPEEQAAVKKAVEEANNFPAGTTVEVRPDGTVVITYPDKSVDTITGDKLVEKGSKQETPKVQTDAEKNPAQVPGNFVPVENTHNLTQTEQDTVAAKVKEANPAATDVKVSKDGTAVITYKDGSVNTIPGTSLVVAKDTNNEASTQAAQNPAVVPATTTEVGNAHSLTPEEQAAVATKVKQANPTATDVKVSKDGTATLTYSDGSVNTIPGTSLVVQKEETSTQEQPTIAEKTKVIIPANPTKVAEATRLTDAEKEAVKKAVVDANGFGSDVKVEVAGDGTATIVFKDGSAITIPGNQLVTQDSKAQDSTKPTAEKSTVKAPAQRVDVKDITHLTDEEKEKVKVAILQANGSALDGATINVAGDGTATITFPDGSVVTILGKDTVQQSAKGKSVTQETTPEYKPETTPGGDNGGNTGSSDANANAGGGSQAGGQANTGSQNSAQSQASKQLATEKESAKNAIEKAAKDKQNEIKGAPLSDKEKAELLARVEAEKQAALKEIENAKTVEDVKEAETIGVQAIAMVTVPKRPVAPNAAPQATSAPQATAGTMQDVTYQSPARKQLPNTGSASSAALASLGLVAATSGFALLGRKARRRK
ncbi:DUF1542 domain-containing protein [Streptococcus mitis]|uniref:DUF1542 domain-containing protein n=1 Tax=Streptococcus mitis TaxID=28037 RepID=UPI00398C090C